MSVGKIINQFFLVLVSILFFQYTYGSEGECIKEIDVQKLYGRFEVRSYERYKAGLTSADDLKSKIGEVIVINQEKYKDFRRKTLDPKYELFCYEYRNVEGNVISGSLKHTTKYYGKGVDRSEIVKLKVRDSKNSLIAGIEVISYNQLWLLVDGFIIELIRCE